MIYFFGLFNLLVVDDAMRHAVSSKNRRKREQREWWNNDCPGRTIPRHFIAAYNWSITTKPRLLPQVGVVCVTAPRRPTRLSAVWWIFMSVLSADAGRGVHEAQSEQRQHWLHGRELPTVDELQALRRPRPTDGLQGESQSVDDSTGPADCCQVARIWLDEPLQRPDSQCCCCRCCRCRCCCCC